MPETIRASSSWALGESSPTLGAKYPSVSAYEVRPGILMTAKYTEDGQVCEMVLETRHYQTPQNIDFGSVIPAKLEDRLIDELVPTSERGEPKHRWSNKEPKDAWVDPDSFIAGGRSYTKRSYENVTVEEHGYYACHENPYSKPKGKLDCSEGGDEVVVIRWTKRRCTVGKSNGSLREVPEGNGRATAGEGARDKGKSEAEAFRRDNLNAVVLLLDTGRIALETHLEEIAIAMRKFLLRVLM
jgi:hypothetical protein